MRRVIAAALFLALATWGGQADAVESWKGEQVMVDGVVHVKNPAAPVEEARTVSTTEVWRFGEEASDVVVGNVGSFLRDGDGNGYILDTQLSQIYVVGPDGAHLRTIGREGEGPAEFGAASGMVMTGDGVVCVSQMMPPRVVEILPDGQAAGDFPLPHDLVTAFINGCASVDDGLVLFLGEVTEGETGVVFRSFVTKVDAKGEMGATYWEKLQSADFANITFDEKDDASMIWAVSHEGRVYVNESWDDYAITAIGPAGDERRVIERDYEPAPRPEWQRQLVDVRIEKQQIAAQTKIAETGRTIVDVFPRDGGTLWVLTDRGENHAPDGAVVFDVFDGAGRFTRQVVVRGPYVPGRDQLFIDGECVAIVVNGGAMGGSDIFAGAGGDDVPVDVEVRLYRLADVD